ncbi:lysine 2,3-aminomutase [Myxococcota bacterium]|nr:lysine 2,3-aminomutase [Myxococcota bacterium]
MVHQQLPVSLPQRRFRAYGAQDLEGLLSRAGLPKGVVLAMRAVATVLPFRTNDYVMDELVDWSDLPNDPIFQLTFPQPEMLEPADLDRMMGLLRRDVPRAEIDRAAREIQLRLNPHPAGQLDLNVPRLDGRPLHGLQHKYPETVLFFPSQGQTCHAYCTYCFRWPQFVGLDELSIASLEIDALVRYVRAHPEVTSVLFTGGDPLVMKTTVLRRYIEPLLDPSLGLLSIRIGTKAPAYWPHRFLTDRDADDLLGLFEEVRGRGRHLALMAHFTHPRELETEAAREALRRIQGAGAVIRCQAPLVAHVNDDAQVWTTMWRHQIRLGAVPYYMFVERDTGPKDYFSVPLGRAWQIYRDAVSRMSGLGRTVRGPSMSATPGKVVIDGVANVRGEDVFVLRFLQARDPSWVGRPFFARFDPRATWLDQLEPAFGEPSFFWSAPAEREDEPPRAARLLRVES